MKYVMIRITDVFLFSDADIKIFMQNASYMIHVIDLRIH